jgi:NADPH:quinone reductase-like Zn-dependent oxidoreductase
MRNLVVFGGQGAKSSARGLRPVTVDGLTLACGIVETAPPPFPADAAESANAVLVRVRALSCNYRDRAFIHLMGRCPARYHFPLGSEFAAEVVAVGSAVIALRPGDRVIPNHHYVGGAVDQDGVAEGVITNKASRELQVFHQRKLVLVPPEVPFEVGASFSLGAQTAYSMARKVAVRAGDRVLVTSATSNTSLFLISALRARGVEVYASTTTSRFHARLAALGVEQAFAIGAHREGFPGAGELARAAGELGGFDAVLDPFFDLHLRRAVELLRPFGRYVTCGFAAQNPELAAQAGPADCDALPILQAAIVKNLTLIGNCCGLREDLEQAVTDHLAGKLAPVLDSVFTGQDVNAFLDRTFNDRQRFGKVVFQYAA